MSKQCPHCLKTLDMDQGMSRDRDGQFTKSKPRIGDVTICLECGQFCEFGPDDTLLKITDAEKMDDLKENKDAMLAKKLVDAIKNHKDGKKYEEQVKQMAKAVREWTRANPDLSPMLQRNATSKIGIIATLTDAIESKFISVNDDAMLMFNELGWLDVNQRMPTVFMAEAAIEFAFKDDKTVD